MHALLTFMGSGDNVRSPRRSDASHVHVCIPVGLEKGPCGQGDELPVLLKGAHAVELVTVQGTRC